MLPAKYWPTLYTMAQPSAKAVYTVSQKHWDHIINDCNLDKGPQNYAYFYQVILNQFDLNAKIFKEKPLYNF